MRLSKDTEKFWSFKDTRSHKNIDVKNFDKNLIRIFRFKKSFLLKVNVENADGTKSIIYTLPLNFVSCVWPEGFYTAYHENKIISFVDEDIISIES